MLLILTSLIGMGISSAATLQLILLAAMLGALAGLVFGATFLCAVLAPLFRSVPCRATSSALPALKLGGVMGVAAGLRSSRGSVAAVAGVVLGAMLPLFVHMAYRMTKASDSSSSRRRGGGRGREQQGGAVAAVATAAAATMLFLLLPLLALSLT